MSTDPLLKVVHLLKEFTTGRRTVHAVNDVTFTIGRGESIGLVGESGCGKSTLGRCILGLLPTTSGRVIFDGVDVTRVRQRQLRRLRRDLEIVFQDPTTALNPRWPVRRLVREPLVLHGFDNVEERVHDTLRRVELPLSVLNRRPSQLSGGQRQRVAIARAIATNPRFVVLDEPTASVDMSIRLSILKLLRDLQVERQFTYLFISHDLTTVRQLCNRVLVMYLGKIVERGPTTTVFHNPAHVYTKVLLSSVPTPDPNHRGRRLVVHGEPPSPTTLPSGCPFQPRCPEAADECMIPQPMYEVDDGHQAACRLAKPRLGSPPGALV